MKRGLSLLALFVILLLLALIPTPSDSPVQAQDNELACDTLINDALTQVANMCLSLGRNEVCYGNAQVTAALKDEDLFFEAPGDIVPVSEIEAIFTRPADPETDEWGVAIMDVQADLPEGEDSVRLILLGGVDIQPTQTAVTEENRVTCQFTNTASTNLRLRAGPATSYSILDLLEPRLSLEVYGQSPDGAWLRSSRGWVAADFGDLACDGAELPVIEAISDSYTAPMQSFTLQVNDQAECQAAPSGMLIQSPSGQTANFLVNNVEVRIGSTAFLMPNGEQLLIANFDGNVTATLDGQTFVLKPGEQVVVPSTDTPSETNDEQGQDETNHDSVEPLSEFFDFSDLPFFTILQFSEFLKLFDINIINTLMLDTINFPNFAFVPQNTNSNPTNNAGNTSSTDDPTTTTDTTETRDETATNANPQCSPASEGNIVDVFVFNRVPQTRVYVYFVNSNCVEQYWGLVEPDGAWQFSSYEGHVWVVRHPDTNQELTRFVATPGARIVVTPPPEENTPTN